MAASLQGLFALIEPAVASCGADLEDITTRRVGHRSVITVIIDRDGGADSDTVARVSREVSAALSGARYGDSIGYALEVTSPGVDRPLRLARHWRRNVGRLVAVELAGESEPTDPEGSRRGEGHRLTGRIVAVDDDGVKLEVDGQLRGVGFRDVSRAVVQVEFSRPDRDG